jgi:hypothetical protein
VEIVKYYQRKLVWSISWLAGGFLFFLQGMFRFQIGDFGFGFFLVFVALIFLIDAYIYRRPYLGLGEGKLVIYLGLRSKEIMLADITMSDYIGKNIVLTYNQGSSTKKQKIELTTLRESDREGFIRDLNLELGK